jgi:hypothetical protein
MIDHKFVTGIIDGTAFPAVGFRPFVTDQKIWVAFCRKHIGNILDVFKIACELDALNSWIVGNTEVCAEQRVVQEG